MRTARTYTNMPSQVRIVVRTRPTDFVTNNFNVMSENTLCITRPNGDVSTATTPHANTKTISPGGTGVEDTQTFTVDAILQNASQEVVYNTAASDLVEAVVQGFNCTLLCHGQSGSGKTYTLFGGNAFPTRGCVPRAIQAIFDMIKLSSEREFQVSLTFVEVYGEQVYDLLGGGPCAAAVLAAATKFGGKESGATNKAASVTIDTSGAVVLRGVATRRCASEGEALAAVFEGLQRRLSGANPLNPQSSRSHAVLTLYVVSKSLIDSDAVVHHSRFNFVDLASSDRPHAAGDEAAAHETRVINKSLAMLEQVVLALAAHRPRHVPYRQSKLTMLLKDSIGGSSRTTLIANIWPEPRHTEATIATLNFAKRMVRVESKPAMHASMDPEAQIKVLQKQLLSLKAELRMQDQLAGREAVATAPLETDEIQTARERVEAFIDGNIPQVSVTCVREMHACFLAFKSILEERDAIMKEMEHQLAITTPRPGSSSSAKSSAKRKYSTRQQNNAESRETIRYVTSTMDPSTGVGVGSTDKLSPGLREMFQQQHRSVSFSAQAAHNNTSTARGSNADYIMTSAIDGTIPNNGTATTSSTTTTTATTAAPPHTTTSVSQNTTAAAATTSAAAAVAATKAAAPMTTFSPSTDEDLMKGRSYPPGSSYSPPRDTFDNTLSPMDQHAFTAPLPSVKGLGRQEGVVRDKRVAFEMYKRTPNGVCQLEVINNAQKLVAEKNEEILRLQHRIQEIKADMDSNKKGQSLGMTTIEERVTSRYTTSRTGHTSMEISESSDVVNENNNNNNNNNNIDYDATLPPNVLHASLTDDLRNMTATEKKALLSHTNRAVTRALTERGVLVKQLNRHREAFMNNFQYWYKSSLQSTILPQRVKVEGDTAGSDVLPTLKSTNSSSPLATATPRVTIFAEGDVRFVDGGEQFEAAEMQRRLQKDPDGVAFYAAQDLVKKRLSSRQ